MYCNQYGMACYRFMIIHGRKINKAAKYTDLLFKVKLSRDLYVSSFVVIVTCTNPKHAAIYTQQHWSIDI